MSENNNQESISSQEITHTLHVGELVDLAHKIAKEQFREQSFTFSNIWSKVWKSADRFSKEKVASWIGYFYTELITDTRFLVYGFHSIKLREFVNQGELKKMERVVLFSDEPLFEEEHQIFTDRRKNKDVETVVTENSSGDMGVFDDESEEDDLDENKDDSEIFESEEE